MTVSPDTDTDHHLTEAELAALLANVPTGLLAALLDSVLTELSRPGADQVMFTAARNRLAAALAQRPDRPTHRGEIPP